MICVVPILVAIQKTVKKLYVNPHKNPFHKALRYDFNLCRNGIIGIIEKKPEIHSLWDVEIWPLKKQKK